MNVRKLGQSDLKITPIGIGAAVTGAIVGVRKAQQVDGVIGAAGIDLNSNDLLEIDEVMALQAA